MSIVRVPFSLTGGGAAGYVPAGAIWLDGSADYLSWTPSGAADSATVYTASVWVKRAELGRLQRILVAGDVATGNNYEMLWFDSDDTLRYDLTLSAVVKSQYFSNAVFRDPTAWLHIHVTRSGATVTISVNGTAITSWATATAPGASDAGMWMQANEPTTISYQPWGGTNRYQGLVSEVVMLDGTSSAVTNFGEFDANGNWIPVNPTGLTFGTNGFWLDFANSADLGNDVSGNGNDFTPTSMSAANSTSDRPADDAENGIGNYCVWNPIDAGTGTLSSGNLVLSGGTVDRSGTFGMSSGKWAWKITTAETKAFGVVQGGLTGTESTYAATSGEVLEFQFDVDTGTLDVSIDGGAYSSVATGLTSGPYFPLAKGNCTADFGQNGFTLDDSSFKYLNTANLPAPTVTDPSAYMQSVLYEGNGTAVGSGGNAITGAGFQPDFVWIKNRDAADSHMIFDAVRGVTKYIESDTTAAEVIDTESLSTFDTDGFTVGNNVAVNTNAESYVAWCLKAGGSGSSNTDGSITSTVSVADHGGFSIITYTGTGSNATVGHGLSSAPDLILNKNRSGTARSWRVYSSGLTSPGTQYLSLDGTSAEQTDATMWNSTAPTTTVFSIGTDPGVNTSSQTNVVYALARTPGLIGIGSYTGNGSADGPYVVVDDGASGFRPAFVMIKRVDAGTENWSILDNKRDPYNVADAPLLPNAAVAESAVTWNADFTSNGFKVRSATTDNNTSGGTYIYLAFAEYPFGGDGVAQAKAR
jgi:hypothetical protein